MTPPLKGEQLKQITQALLAAFPDEDALAMMVKFELDKNLNELASGGNITVLTFKFVEWAVGTGNIENVVAGALRQNPGATALQDVAASLPGWLGKGAPLDQPGGLGAPAPRFRPEAREIDHDVLLAFIPSPQDASPKQIAAALTSGGFRPRLAPTALFATAAAEFGDLEADVRRCHTAMIVVSTALLDHMEQQPEQSRRVLKMLQARTGDVVALCPSAACVERAAGWEFAPILDLSGWQPESANGAAPWTAEAAQIITERRQDRHRDRHQHAAGKIIGLPFLVVSMTDNDVADLLRLAAEPPGDRELRQFLELKTALDQGGFDHITARYGPRREDWKPFAGSVQTIRQVIADTVLWLNERELPELRGRWIKAQHYSLDPLIEDDKALRPVYNELAKMGCIVVVDEVTLFLAAVLDPLVYSRIYSSPAVAWVTISPFNPFSQGPRQLLEKELEVGLKDAFFRFDQEFDPQCEVGVGDERRLKRWLHGSLPQAVDALRELSPNRENLARFREEQGPLVGAGPFEDRSLV